MKDFILLIVILMCVIGVGMWQVSYLEETSRYMKTDLNYTNYYINLDKYDEAMSTITNLKNTWSNMKDTWAMFIHHDDIEYIELAIAEIESYIGNSSKEDAMASISALKTNIEYTVECEKIKIENIF